MSGIQVGRISGLLLLLVFVLGVLTFQVLQTPVLSGPANVMEVATHSSQIITSVFVSLLGGSLSIWIAVLLIPIFRRSSETLAYAYLAFTIVNFVAIAIDTVSVMSVLELGRVATGDGALAAGLNDALVNLVYGQQWWTHHIYLLVSCFPVAILFIGLYVSRTVPRALSLFGIFAACVMGIEMVGLMLGDGISDHLFLPIALVQVATPLWLLAKGLIINE